MSGQRGDKSARRKSARRKGAAGRETIKVGLLHSLSGTMARSEQPLLDAELMAIDEINASGGVLGRPIEPVVADGASLPDTFAEKVRELLSADQGVASVFGCWTSASRKAVKPIIEAADGLLWYPVQYEGLEQSSCIIYTGSCLNQQISPAVEWVVANKGPRMLLVGSDYVFPRSANRLIRALVEIPSGSGEIVGEFYVPLGGEDFAEVIAGIREGQPDVVFNTINGDSNLAFYSRCREAGIDADRTPIIAVSAGEVELRPVSEVAAGHFACWSYFQCLDSPANRRFVADFKKRYGKHRVCSDPMATAYTQIHLFKSAAEKAGSIVAADVRSHAIGSEFTGPLGHVVVAADNHVPKRAYIGRLAPDGQFTVVWDSGAAVAPLPWLGVEKLDLATKGMVLEAMSSFPEAVHRGVQDAAERKRAEDALHESAARFQSFMRNFPGLAYIKDGDGRVLFASEGFSRYLGLDPDDMRGKTTHELLPEEFAEAISMDDRRVLESGRNETIEEAFAGRTWASEKFPIPQGEEPPLLGGLTVDITERKKAEESLRKAMDELDLQGHRMEELAKRVIDAQETERRYLAAEIHDQLVQGLVATSYFLQALDTAGLDAKASAICDKLVGVLNDSIGAGRGLIREMEPIREPEVTLAQAIREAGELRFEGSGVEVDLRHPKDLPDIGWAVKINVLRIVQEALMNVRRHAKASRVKVRLVPKDGGLEVLVEDDGVGFDTAVCSRAPIGHYGLLTMKERARLVGGDLSVESAPGKGTVVRGIFPPSRGEAKKSAPRKSAPK